MDHESQKENNYLPVYTYTEYKHCDKFSSGLQITQMEFIQIKYVWSDTRSVALFRFK